MIDFSKVKSFVVPEGDVSQVSYGDKVLWSIHKYKYVTGQLSCSDGNRFNNYSDDSSNVWELQLTLKVDDLSTERVLAQNISGSVGWKISLNTSGQIVYYTYYTKANTYTFTQKINVGEWNTVSMSGQYGTSGTAGGQVISVINDVSEAATGMYQTSLTRTARTLYVGGDGISLRDTIKIKGSYYASSTTTTYHTLSVNIEDATVGSELSLTDTYTLSGGMVYEDKEN